MYLEGRDDGPLSLDAVDTLDILGVEDMHYGGPPDVLPDDGPVLPVHVHQGQVVLSLAAAPEPVEQRGTEERQRGRPRHGGERLDSLGESRPRHPPSQ